MAAIVAKSGSYTADTTTDLYVNSGETDVMILSMSVYNGDSSGNLVELYTTTSGNVIQEWLLKASVAAGTIIGTGPMKVWVPAGYKIRFKAADTDAIISANMYGGIA